MEASNIPIWLIQSGFGVGGVLVGAAVIWGVIKERVENVMKTVEKHSERIEKLEQRGGLMFRPDCLQFRQECHSDLSEKFQEVKDGISQNREMVIEKFQEITEFMGYVKRAIENGNKKSNR